MKKYFLIFATLIGLFAHGLETLDTAPSKTSNFSNIKMVNDSAGNTLVLWVETVLSPPFFTVTNFLKWAYKPAQGNFGETQILGEVGLSDILFDVALDSEGNACVVWTGLNLTFNSYRLAGDNTGFTSQVAFEEGLESFKLKAAPNKTFLLITSNQGGYKWSERGSKALNNFSPLTNVFPNSFEGGAGVTSDFDFDFDDQSNVLFAGFASQDFTATIQSDVFFTFKPVGKNFKNYQVIPRINNNYYSNNMNVIYNAETSLGRTWSMFWSEARFDFGEVFFLRGQLLNNTSSNMDINLSTPTQTLYSVSLNEDQMLDQFQVSKKQGTTVLGHWVMNYSDIFYTVFDVNNLLTSGASFDIKEIPESGINPVNISVATQYGFSLMTWNTRGQEGGDIRWGFIPQNSCSFNYQYGLQQAINGIVPFSKNPQIGFNGITPIFSWIGSLNPYSEKEISVQATLGNASLETQVGKLYKNSRTQTKTRFQ